MKTFDAFSKLPNVMPCRAGKVCHLRSLTVASCGKVKDERVVRLVILKAPPTFCRLPADSESRLIALTIEKSSVMVVRAPSKDNWAGAPVATATEP